MKFLEANALEALNNMLASYMESHAAGRYYVRLEVFSCTAELGTRGYICTCLPEVQC